MQNKQSNGNKPCVLIVDDSRVVRKSLMRILESDYELVEAVNGAAGWTALTNDSRIDLVVTDIEMPELDGYGFICRVRAVEDPGLRDVPMVVITSAEDDITRERAYACGANDFILKPIEAGQLRACLRAQLADTTDAAPTHTAGPVTAPATTVVPNTNSGTLKDAVHLLESGLKILSGLKTAVVAPHALVLMLRLMPLLKFCNARFALGMDHEISVIQERLNTTRIQLAEAKAGTT